VGGPRIYASGPLLDGPASTMKAMSETAGEIGDGPLDQLIPILVSDSASAATAVNTLADEGVDFVKLYQRLPPEAFRAAVAKARERDVPVAVDLGTVFAFGLEGSYVDIVDAAKAGVTSIEHLSGLALAYERRGGDVFARPLDEQILSEVAADILATGVAAVPTLAIFDQQSTSSTLDIEGLPGSHLAPAFEGFWEMRRQWAAARPDAVEADRDLARALLRKLHRGGMTIGAGSDLPAGPGMVPGGALHLELEALVEAGLTPTEALQAATANAAAILQRPDLGHVRSGAMADILIVEGDPTRDIAATRNVQRVWLGGVEVDLDSAWNRVEEELAREMARHP
jgi:imidazolonepropionase-like amidohydrolase